MVSKKEITQQLKKIKFNHKGWGRSEISELPRIILPGEEIYECVNGFYDGGFALIVATDIRVLLIDKKPLSFLTVEDMRYDMISEMDYNHRLLGADISITSGGKTLHFRSYNKIKLRELIGHVQHCIADNKKQQSNHQDSQVSHLEQINKQLQEYLFAQQQYQLDLQRSQPQATADADVKAGQGILEPPRPNNELADYLYAQSLLKQYNQEHDKAELPEQLDVIEPAQMPITQPGLVESEEIPIVQSGDKQMEDIHSEGIKEVFGKSYSKYQHKLMRESRHVAPNNTGANDSGLSFAINPSRIAFSKLPMALRNRKFAQQAGTPKPANAVVLTQSPAS